jgi:RNA polymerase sigma-70 factor (ECF subfamily)
MRSMKKTLLPGTGDVVRTDGSLLLRLRSGEQEAATALYQRYASRIEAIAKARTSQALAPRLDAQDVVQSVFRTFFRRAAAGQYEIPKGAELWNLLYAISLNKIRSLAAYHQADKRSASATGAWTDAEHGPAEEENGLVLMRLIIGDVLATLPDDQRRMVEMRIEGNHIAEIALATGRSMRSVERLLQDFRRRLSRIVFEEPRNDGE